MTYAIKRTLDITIALFAALLFAPIALVLTLATLIDSGTPILFTPIRVGRNFQTFKMYKFRSMVKDAHAQLPHLAHLNVAPGMIKIPNDPRVTGVGRWLRRYSLDELPQLINVIKGDMSLVGPRPYAANEVSVNNELDRERLLMRPGLTGTWQVSARSDPSIEKRLEKDLEYVRHFSILLDLRIMLRTLPVLLGGQGGEVAYAQAASCPPETSLDLDRSDALDN